MESLGKGVGRPQVRRVRAITEGAYYYRQGSDTEYADFVTQLLIQCLFAISNIMKVCM